MEGSRNFTIKEAKEIDLIHYMSTLGLQPTRISGNAYWFLSPFPDRNEKTASLKVDRKRNTWKDFGDGRGGTIIDFTMHYYQCNIPSVLEILSGETGIAPPFQKQEPFMEDPATKIQVINDRVITNTHLVNYLHERRISLHVANQFCREIDFINHGKEYTGIGFKNNFGGYEIRNKYFKGSCSPKDVSHITLHTNDNFLPRLNVFEGFMDFLSFQIIFQKQHYPPSNFLILNSLSFFERAKSIMESYPSVHLYLDRDDSGIAKTLTALQSDPRYIDESHLYAQYKDLNDMLINIGKSPNCDQCHRPVP